jgi:hypothetical protein
MSTTLQLPIDREKLRDFCQRWSISELAIFGSALRDDFGPHSDVDFLATFDPQSRWSLLDQVRMQEELAQIVGRPIDLVSRRGIEMSANKWRRQEILSTAETVYAA